MPAFSSIERHVVIVASAVALCASGLHAQQPARARTPEARVSDLAASGPVAEVLALEQQIEEAVVRGDVAFVDRVTAPDFSFVHGDGWTRGERPLATDDKAAFLGRVRNREYLVHDLDNVKTEMHGDVAITFGRYVSLFVPPNRATATPPRLNSIWFERVYAKRNGEWQFLSHRTVHGPNVAPAGVDPTAEPRDTFGRR